MSGPNLSKEPGDGSAQPSNPYSSPAPDAGPPGPPPYESAPQGAPYQNQYAASGSSGYPYTAPASTNAMALGSLIASIAGWTVVPFVGWIVGVVLGHIARSQLRQSNEQGAGLALAGLITGYVGLALSAIAVVFVIVVFVFVGVSYESW
ncbi:DUF4190 domain-containing protein [Sanguibacter sp. 25GB23B1]|uniref:DUF4190 domain-containing protein n=1 Tax=unclassified Sanguibacter TaxID=2645534 RepID=UPI0032B023BA